ncbi:hypothetical protein KCV03_g16, partial [Aureobasidium melanogenum]
MAMVATKVRVREFANDSITAVQDDDPGNSHGDDMAVHDSGMLYLSKLPCGPYSLSCAKAPGKRTVATTMSAMSPSRPNLPLMCRVLDIAMLCIGCEKQ